MFNYVNAEGDPRVGKIVGHAVAALVLIWKKVPDVLIILAAALAGFLIRGM